MQRCKSYDGRIVFLYGLGGPYQALEVDVRMYYWNFNGDLIWAKIMPPKLCAMKKEVSAAASDTISKLVQFPW